MLYLAKRIILFLTIIFSSVATAKDSYLVIGVIHSKNDQESVALIKELSSGKTFARRIGQPFEGKKDAHVVKIGERSVEIRNGDRQIVLKVGGNYSSFAEHSTVASRLTEGIEVRGSTVNITETYRDHVVKNELAKVLMQAAAIPQFDNGQLSGFKLWDIDPGSIYEKMGFKNGDIVTSINDQALIDVGSTIRLLHVLKEESAADVAIRRDGAVQVLNIRVQ